MVTLLLIPIYIFHLHSLNIYCRFQFRKKEIECNEHLPSGIKRTKFKWKAKPASEDWRQWPLKCFFLNKNRYFKSRLVKGLKNVVLKLASAIFIKFLFLHQMIVLQKLWKMLFISSKKLFLFSRYSNFCISVLPSFSACRPLL